MITRRGAAIAALLLLLGTSRLAAAEPAQPTADPAPLLSWRFDGQAYVYGTGLARSPNSALNPGNLYVRLPNEAVTGELRPNARATSEYADFVFHPRLTSVYQNGGVPEQETVRGYIQEGYVRLKPSSAVTVTIGRELLTWGPAFFRSPSNPYYFNNARIDPITELSGIDVARATYSGSQWSLTGGVIVQSGHNLVANDAYRGSLLLKADYQGSDYAGSLILASKRGQSVFTGGYAQATISDAILGYFEFGASSADYAVDPVANAPPALKTFATRRSATLLAGGSYTFQNGTSLYGEYLYNGFGYDSAGERRFIAQARQGGLDTLLGGSLGGLASSNLGSDASQSQNLLGRHYVYAQYQNNPAQGSTLWRLMAAHNLTDHSTQFSAYLEQNVSDRISLFVLGVYNAGSQNSEFPALFRASLMAGVKTFLF